MDGIEWRIIEDFPVYEVSNTGLIRRREKQNLIAPRMLRNGYMQLGLCRGSGQIFRMVHRLVAFAFIGTIPEGMEVNHKDGNKLNNHVDNLEYVTHRQNMIHARSSLGNPGKKLTSADVVEIRRRLGQKHRHADIATEFGISKGTVMYINTNRVWNDGSHSWADGRKKLTLDQVVEIKHRLSSGEVHASIADDFCVSDSTIDNIANNKSWKQVKG